MTLEELMELANSQQAAERRVEEATQALEKAKERLKSISEDLLPTAMSSLGITELRLASGDIIRVTREVAISIPEARAEEAFDWLAREGFGGIVKTDVRASFSAGERERAFALAEEIAAQHSINAEVKQNVHPMTLKAWAKERLEQGESFPPAFSVYPFNKTKITKR